MAFENEAARLRKLAKQPDVLFGWTRHADVERQKDDIAKIDVHNMLRRCSVSNVEETEGETTWRAEGRDVDGRGIVAIIVAYEDDHCPEIKIITTWAKTKS